MPHCQKEKHNHQSHSKKEKQKKQTEKLAKKNALLKAKEDAEKEKMMKMMGGNNLTLKDGFGEYIVGCEEEMEYVAKFNMNKRSKKVSEERLLQLTRVLCVWVWVWSLVYSSSISMVVLSFSSPIIKYGICVYNILTPFCAAAIH